MRLLLPLAALAALFAAPAQAQFIDDLDRQPVAEEAPPAEAIQVHGKWAITVRNPDGSLVEERVFHNALTSGGAFLLGAFLLGVDIDGVVLDAIEVGAADDTDHPCERNGSPAFCQIVPPGSGFGFETLTYDVDPFSLNEGFALVGSFQAQRDGSIGEVVTRALQFDPLVGDDRFTAKTLDAPIPVTSGQSVDVRVEISFE